MKKAVNVIVLLMIFIMINVLPVYAAATAEDSGGSGVKAGTDSLDGVMKGAEDFLAQGSKTPVDEGELKQTSNLIYNILLGMALIIAVVVGTIIGIKFMVASVDEKAKIKEQLVPYVAGCIVVFGAFGIWKLVITILATW